MGWRIERGGDGGTYGRTFMRCSSAPAWSGMMMSHSCCGEAMVRVEVKGRWEVERVTVRTGGRRRTARERGNMLWSAEGEALLTKVLRHS